MRREGDRLVVHLARAERDVLLCAPFIKRMVLERLLEAVRPDVPVRIVTRWLPAEVRAGVSDLEVLDLVRGREGTDLLLLDALHAKAYASDDRVLAGSANLTAAALGWRDPGNVEILVPLADDDPDFAALRGKLAEARLASDEERERVRIAAAALPPQPDADGEDPGEMPLCEAWLPIMAAPQRLGEMLGLESRSKLPTPIRDAAEADLSALGVAIGGAADAFVAEVREAFRRMPAVAFLLEHIEGNGLSDEDAAVIVERLVSDAQMKHARRWDITREWIQTLLGDRIEVTPTRFLTRRIPGKRMP